MGQPFGREKGHGVVAAFAIALGVSLALPPFMRWFLLHAGDAHGAVGFFVLLPLAGAYPFISVAVLPIWLAWSLTALQMIALSALFARYGRALAVHEQILAAILLVVLLAVVGDILYALFDLELRSRAFAWE
jgi:hypothetical protein